MNQLRLFSISALVILVALGVSTVIQSGSSHAAAWQSAPATFTGRWRVKFSLTGDKEKNLIVDAKANGGAALQLLDTGADDKPVTALQSAVWVQLTNDRVSFSSEVELALGTCCRELGTLMFKGKFVSSNAISGKLIFVTNVDEEESPYKFRSLVGTFTAARLADAPHNR